VDKFPELSLILPAYNEEDNIELAAEKCLKSLDQLVETYELIIVDDGSTDRTSEVINLLAKSHKSIKCIYHNTNKGYGTALCSGFNHARYKFLFYTDSDNQFDVSEIKYLFPFMNSYDIAVGFRVYRYDTVLRCISSWIYNRLVRLISSVRVRDIDCAFKLFKRDVFEQITIDSKDFFVDTEILIKAHHLGYRIAQIGVRHYPRMAGRTTVRPSNILRTLCELCRIWISVYLPKIYPLIYGKRNGK